jgi:hypothetical protein
VRTASRVAVISGLGLMALLLSCSRPLLSLYIGTYTFTFTFTFTLVVILLLYSICKVI